MGTGGEGSSLGTFPVTKVTDGTTVVSNTVLSGGVNAYGVSIRFKAETAAVTTTSGGSRAATRSSSATTTSKSTRMPESDSGLSPGAKAGVGAGTAAVGVALLALIAWFALRRRKRARVLGDETQQYNDQPSMYGKPSIYGSVPNSDLAGREIIKPELRADLETGELPGNGALAKGPGRGLVHELS